MKIYDAIDLIEERIRTLPDNIMELEAIAIIRHSAIIIEAEQKAGNYLLKQLEKAKSTKPTNWF